MRFPTGMLTFDSVLKEMAKTGQSQTLDRLV